MIKLINKVLFYSKIMLLVVVFTITLYIALSMNAYYKSNIINLILLCLPFLLILIMFISSFFMSKWKDNLIYNMASNLAFIAILIIDFRTIFDKNMVMWIDGNMNFYYFQNSLLQISILAYGVFIGSILLIKSKNV